VGVRLKFDLKTDLHEVWHTDIVRFRVLILCNSDIYFALLFGQMRQVGTRLRGIRKSAS